MKSCVIVNWPPLPPLDGGQAGGGSGPINGGF